MSVGRSMPRVGLVVEALVAVYSDRDIPTYTGRNEVEDFAHMPADMPPQAEEVDVDVHDAPWESIYRVGRVTTKSCGGFFRC